jgi:hypothetical protein
VSQSSHFRIESLVTGRTRRTGSLGETRRDDALPWLNHVLLVTERSWEDAATEWARARRRSRRRHYGLRVTDTFARARLTVRYFLRAFTWGRDEAARFALVFFPTLAVILAIALV